MGEQTRGHDGTGMVWWPYQQYKLLSKLSPQQIVEKLDHEDEEHVLYAVSYNHSRICISESSDFKFGAHSRSFKPEAILAELPEGEGSGYSVVIKPSIGAMLLLLLVVLLIIGGIAFSKRYDLLIHHYKDTAIACVCVLMMGYFLPIVTFNAELTKLKSFIGDLLEAEQ